MARHLFEKSMTESQQDGAECFFNHTAPQNSVRLPSVVDLRPFCPPVTDQGETGFSAAHTLAAARTMLAKSVSLLFSVSMQEYGDQIGISVKEMIGVLKKDGICLAPDSPVVPSAIVKDQRYRIHWGARVRGLLGAKIALFTREQPILLGLTVFESFEGSELARTGVVQMPAPGETALGGHHLLIVGWTDIVQGKIMPIDGWSTTKEDCDDLDRLFHRYGNMGYFIARNSWGPNWGKNGYCLLPYEYAIKYGREQWTIG